MRHDDRPITRQGVAVLVPVKAFRHAKGRLAPTLGADARAALARSMAERVVRAAAPLPVAVVCDDEEVRSWARDLGAMVLHEPGRGLNGAVESGVAQLRDDGVRSVVIAHADLPLARALAWVADFDGVTLVPDRRNDGTNVLCVPSDVGFVFSYGARSFARHHAEARRLGLPVRVAPDRWLGTDVDLPSDLAAAGELLRIGPPRSR